MLQANGNGNGAAAHTNGASVNGVSSNGAATGEEQTGIRSLLPLLKVWHSQGAPC